MPTAIAVGDSKDVARPLKVLVPLIKDELAAGDEAGLEHYRRAGEMLNEAKEQVAAGQWGAWLDRNFDLSQGQARRYMVLARKLESSDRRRSIRTIQDATEPERRERIVPPIWHEPVRQIASRVDVDALRKEAESRAREERLTRQLGMQLIDIGYKVLATKLHPDKGGSKEAMVRLNRVRDVLRRAIN